MWVKIDSLGAAWMTWPQLKSRLHKFGHLIIIWTLLRMNLEVSKRCPNFGHLFGHFWDMCPKLVHFFGHILDKCPNYRHFLGDILDKCPKSGHILVTFWTSVKSPDTFWSHFGQVSKVWVLFGHNLDTFWTLFVQNVSVLTSFKSTEIRMARKTNIRTKHILLFL